MSSGICKTFISSCTDERLIQTIILLQGDQLREIDNELVSGPFQCPKVSALDACNEVSYTLTVTFKLAA